MGSSEVEEDDSKRRRDTGGDDAGKSGGGKKEGKVKGEKRGAGKGLDGGRRDEEGREMEKEEEEEEEDSPGDLRYETLIKIISSASVGCRGAYTTASRECNDLNGNNSVKDGCSRCPFPMRANLPTLPLRRRSSSFVPHRRCFSFCTKENKKPEVIRRRRVAHENDIVIWARRILAPSGDYNRERRRRQEREMIRGREFARNATIERGEKAARENKTP